MIALSTPLALVSFVSIDVETTGLDPRGDEIVEIGAVKVRNGVELGEFDTLVMIDRTIPLAARRVSGITNEMLIGKPRIEEALGRLWEFAGEDVLVEHSHKAFDIAFLEHAKGSPIVVPCINTCTLSRKLFPFMPKHNLGECCRRHGIKNERQHRALGDARATARLLTCMLETCSARYARLEDLVRVASVDR